MRPKKSQIDKIKANGDLDRVVTRLSAAYFLVNVAVSLYLDSQDILKENGLVLGETKLKANRLQKSFDAYIDDFGAMVNISKQNMNFAKDYDELTPKILKVLGFNGGEV